MDAHQSWTCAAGRLIRTEVADQMTGRQAGGGLVRLHFEKAL
jgi:hypothetical protein